MKYNPSTKEAHLLVHQGLLALSKASQYGMCVDVDYCIKMNDILEGRIKHLSNYFLSSRMGRFWKKIYNKPNLNSDLQLRNILFNKLKMKPIKKTDKGNDSVDNESLEVLAINEPELKTLIDIRKYNKVQGTYIQGYLKEQIDGIMHPNFPLHTTISYRGSSTDPNFQNNPTRDPIQKRLCRKAIKPRQGNQLLAADYKGIELFVGECYHLDPVMKKYCIDDTTDMHKDMALQIFILDEFKEEGSEKILRDGSKNGFVFPQQYGDYYGNNTPVLCKFAKLPTKGRFSKTDGLILMTGKTVGEHLINKGIRTFNDFNNHIKKVEDDFWNNRFKVYKKWKDEWYKEYINKGYMWTKTGFTIQGVLSRNQIINLPVQGSAFHCLLKAFIEVDRRITEKRLSSQLIGQIHDEMLIDLFPPEKEEVIEIINDVTCRWLLEKLTWINIPLSVEVDIYGIDEPWSSKPESIKLAA